MTIPTFPREVAEGLWWLGGCLVPEVNGHKYHSHVVAYLVVGDDRSLFVDTGHPKDWEEVDKALDQVLGERPLDYIFATHNEMPHAGNLPRLLKKYPDVQVIGDIRDYHIFYPGCEPNLLGSKVGDTFDLGGTVFHVTEPVIVDLPSTQWGFDERTRTLFVSDGYGYSHEHEAGQCALTAEELPVLPTPEQSRHVNDKALFWTRFRDMAPLFDRLTEIRVELDVQIIAPAHGSVITRPEAVLPALESGYRT